MLMIILKSLDIQDEKLNNKVRMKCLKMVLYMLLIEVDLLILIIEEQDEKLPTFSLKEFKMHELML